jgi:hypothetical protein
VSSGRTVRPNLRSITFEEFYIAVGTLHLRTNTLVALDA